MGCWLLYEASFHWWEGSHFTLDLQAELVDLESAGSRILKDLASI